ncbi:MAG: leucine-rich repeat domain-containing protein, partial [Clostridia bacterium]|nr:leucine-rich repeat domain-containing protein [Clostridia bacterium]
GLAGVTVGNRVTWIDDYAFSGCTSLTNITLPESLTLFGSYVFKNCSSLTSITIPDGVKSVFGAFDGCSSLTNVTIGKDVTSIGYYTFRGCTSLTSITIPDGVNYIDATAFSNCDKLIQKENGISYIDKWAILCDDGVKSAKFRNDTVGIAAHTFSGHAELTALSLPQTLKYINNSAFKRCSSLTSLIIPDSVTVIQSEAFYGCSELESITLPFVGEYTLGSIFGGSSWVPSSLTTVIITGNSVVASAFSGCSGLTNITIPDSVTSIGSYAFSGCSGLTNITVPDSVTAIGNYAFNGCSGLETVNWNAAECTTDGGNLFPGCNNLTTLNIGNKVTEAPFNAFRACSQLETVTVASANAKYHVTDNCLIETESKTLVMGIKNCIIPADGSVTSIGSYAFNGCSWLTSIVIPDSVTSIGSYAFYGCSGLESITLPFVGAGDAASDYTFKYIFGGSNYNNYVPSSLTTVIITGGSVIGDYAFDGCSNITSISIPNSVTQVGRYAFRGCSGLTSITIPDGVTYIGSSTFSGCSSLTSITIPNGVTYIDSSAFSGCSSLQFNEYGNGCYLGNSSNEYMLLVKPVSNDVTSFTINANTKHIWIFDEVFSTCGNVRFEGTKEQWKKIKLYFNVSTGSSNFTVHCTDGDIDCF